MTAGVINFLWVRGLSGATGERISALTTEVGRRLLYRDYHGRGSGRSNHILTGEGKDFEGDEQERDGKESQIKMSAGDVSWGNILIPGRAELHGEGRRRRSPALWGRSSPLLRGSPSIFGRNVRKLWNSNTDHERYKFSPLTWVGPGGSDDGHPPLALINFWTGFYFCHYFRGDLHCPVGDSRSPRTPAHVRTG